MTKYITIFVTCASRKEAKKIADYLLKKRLIACANVTDNVTSLFWWKGKIDTSSETLLIMKTLRVRFAGIAKEIKRMHSYEVPEIIALPIEAGADDYLNWIRESTKQGRSKT